MLFFLKRLKDMINKGFYKKVMKKVILTN